MGAIKTDNTLWGWGVNDYGGLGQNDTVDYSSPIQIPGTTWAYGFLSDGGSTFSKTDGTLWSWGKTTDGTGGRNSMVTVSSPVQIGSDTDWGTGAGQVTHTKAIKADGTLYSWGSNQNGAMGVVGNPTPASGNKSSPIQIPGTTWKTVVSNTQGFAAATKTDGTLWMWGYNAYGGLGQNNKTYYSSPKQIPGTTWAWVDISTLSTAATKTDGTLWAWGYNNSGGLGQNNKTQYSSPVQIPGTNWDSGTGKMCMSQDGARILAVRTDGTLWAVGHGDGGELGLNSTTQRSSPIQIPGTDWNQVWTNYHNTCWATTRST